jgi:hypothetical protein
MQLRLQRDGRTPLWRHANNDYEYTNQLRGVASHKLFSALLAAAI